MSDPEGLPEVRLKRFETGDDGTFGAVTTPSGLQLYSGELPFRDNAADKSCIVSGTYRVEWAPSPKFKECYHVKDVPGRQNILIHPGNWSGDTDKGFKSNVEGCILLGRAIMTIVGQKGVSSSQDAVFTFAEDMERKPFLLVITNEVA